MVDNVSDVVMKCKNVQELNLTADSHVVDTPINLKRALFDSQRAAVYRLLNLAKTRRVVIGRSTFISHSASLKEPYGSGKSVIMLACIVAMPAVPRIPRSETWTAAHYTFTGTVNGTSSFNRSNNLEITVRNPKALRCSVIVVGSSVVGQWLDRIAEFTSLSVFAAVDYRSIIAFKKLVATGAINSYDIILVKVGITSKPAHKYKSVNKSLFANSGATNIVTCVGDIIRPATVQWAFYDDYDTIKMAQSTETIDALFSVYVSASSKKSSMLGQTKFAHKTIINVPRLTNTTFIRQIGRMPVLCAGFDKHLHSVFGVSSDLAFIKQSMHLPSISATRYKCKRIDDAIVNIFREIAADAEVVEAMNGGANMIANRLMGIKGNFSPTELLKRVMAKKWKKYHTAAINVTSVENFETWLESVIDDLPEHANGKYTVAEIKRTIDEIKAATKALPKIVTPTTVTSFAENMLVAVDAFKATNIETRNENSAELDKIRANVTTGDCPICYKALTSVVIVTCCSLVVCTDCLKTSFEIRGAHGACAGCKKKIHFSKDVIYVSNRAKPMELFGDIHKTATMCDEAPEETMDPGYDEKMTILQNIFRNTAEGDKFTITTPNVMMGSDEVVLDEPAVRRFIIFASHDESLDNTRKVADVEGIQLLYLRGVHSHMTKIVQEFAACAQPVALLINSNRTCAGLDIQMATDLVIYHKIHDRAVLAQIYGRAQRVGRTSNLNVHEILYNNEQ